MLSQDVAATGNIWLMGPGNAHELGKREPGAENQHRGRHLALQACTDVCMDWVLGTQILKAFSPFPGSSVKLLMVGGGAGTGSSGSSKVRCCRQMSES